MTTFREALYRDAKRRLADPNCRYHDNSFKYITRDDKEEMEKAKWVLANVPPPTLVEFLTRRRDVFERLVGMNDYCYGLLADDYSRETLLTRAAFIFLGHLFVRFPYYTEDYTEKRNALHDKAVVPMPEGFVSKEDLKAYGFRDSIYFYDLTALGLPFCCASQRDMPYTFIHDNMYRFAYQDTVIDVEDGDYVLDCGAAFCDTALHFACKAGPNGRVFSFDPNPLMRAIADFNLERNPRLAERITFIPKGTSRAVSTESMGIHALGSTLGGVESMDLPMLEVPTTTIDHEVERLAMPKVDFIKMDIEGAELDALAGGLQTIRRFRPKLAISVYHKKQDLHTIPKFLHDLGLGYTFHMKHHSPIIFETVLYANPA